MSIKTEIEWFACKEKLPPKKESVLIKIKDDGNSTYMATREGNIFFTPWNFTYDVSDIELWAFFPEFEE